MPTATSPVLTEAVEQSYRYCQKIAKDRAKNFYYSFLLLEKPRRRAMCAVYAFMRYCDDLSDEPGAQAKDAAQLQQSISLWRVELDRALNGKMGDNPLWPAFCDTVQRFAIPHRFFHEMIDGVMSDVEPREMETWEELYEYCYRVASVVGLTIIHIFGFSSVRALLLAEKCGVAFQLTNILRDVREDAEMGRVYLPREDLRRFGVSPEQLRLGIENDRFRSLMRFEAERARTCYQESEPLSELIEKKSRNSLWALREIYMRLLARIEKSNYSVLNQRISLPKRTKIGLLLFAFFR
ncbi:MAG TPA: phytoene/squalene synthase family protein [Bryobacteraceae bacterium]|nr:phytoene/squalene synthase family protein [Bryobacteraceae bacterium]